MPYILQPVSEVIPEEKRQLTMELSAVYISYTVAHLEEATWNNCMEDANLVALPKYASNMKIEASDHIGEDDVLVGLPDRTLLPL